MPSWASSPHPVDDLTSVTGDAPLPRRKAKRHTSTAAIFVGALLGTALLAGGTLFGYERYVRQAGSQPVDEPAGPTDLPQQPAVASNLGHGQPSEDQKREKARKIRESIADGDQAVAAGMTDAALSAYLAAFELDSPSPQVIKRIAMVYLMQGKTAEAAGWIARYAERKDHPDVALFETALQAVGKR